MYYIVAHLGADVLHGFPCRKVFEYQPRDSRRHLRNRAWDSAD